MGLFHYLWILGVCTGLCWIGWFFVILEMNPGETGWLSLLLFYISLFLAIIGTLSLVGFLIRWRFRREELAYQQIHVASRQSILFAALVLLALFLQSQRYLTWWTLLILLVLMAGVELFAISYKKFNK